MCRSTSVASLELGSVEDLACGSSPTTATTPPWLRRPGEHGVADRVAGAVEPRRLAVPDADDAVVALVAERVDELAAHHRGGGELLVEAGTDDDRQVGHGGRRGRRLLLERPDRRALVAGDERRRVQAEAPVDAQLVDGQAGDGLHAGEEDAALLEAEAVGSSYETRGARRVASATCLRCERASASERAASNGLRGRGTRGVMSCRLRAVAQLGDDVGVLGRHVRAVRGGVDALVARRCAQGEHDRHVAGIGLALEAQHVVDLEVGGVVAMCWSRRTPARGPGWRTSCRCSPRPATGGRRRTVCPSSLHPSAVTVPRDHPLRDRGCRGGAHRPRRHGRPDPRRARWRALQRGSRMRPARHRDGV